LEARRMWEDRTIERLKEKQKQQIRVIMSMVTSLLLCRMMYFVGGEMNVEVASESIAQTVTLLVLMSDMVIFYRSSKRLTADVINEDPGKTAELVAQYKRFMKYDDRKLFDRVAKRASMKSLSRAIEAEFPKWLMEVSLLLQTENVQVSIFRSYEDAPKLLQPALKELIYQLRKHPTELMPYVNFLAEFGLSDVRSAMKMLYSLSEGTGGDAERQIEDIIRRNQEMFDRAEKIRNEDKLSGMYALFLAPQVTGGLKLIVDMMLLLTIYLSQMGRVSI
ncbi:MAG: hypothetical protein K6A69_09445, partial [Lachnospiraceae bacterium]|nr:hypothetical protein [Lachnospiraceae bacterium]